MEQRYPFSKNLYFPFKRMRSADFIRDQQFADNKLSFLNHWALGEGTGVGLNVQRVDSDQLVVDPGFAVDCMGRYIVVPEETFGRVRALDGFDTLSGESAVLWLGYAEDPLNPMIVVEDGRETEQDSVARESFRLFLRDARQLPPPKAEQVLFSNFVLFEDNDLRITQSIPILFSSNQSTMIRLIIENLTAETMSLDITYRPTIPGFTGADGTAPVFQKSFDAKIGETIQILSIFPESAGQSSAVRVDESDFELVKQSRRFGAREPFHQTFDVCEGDAAAALEDVLYTQDLQDAWQLQDDGVPLAYLRMIRVEDRCMLDSVVPVGSRYRAVLPFHDECVCRVQDCYGPLKADVPREPDPTPLPVATPVPEPAIPHRKMSSGIVTLSVGLHMAEGKILCSEEITHGLGPGPVYVEFGVENIFPVANDTKNRTDLLLGDVSLFDLVSGSYDTDLGRGVRVHPEKGTFELAVRIKRRLRQSSLRLRWFAWRPDEYPQPSVPTGVLLRLDPDMIRVKTGETVQFTPVFRDGKSFPCEFSVDGHRTGFVSRSGAYTAPDRAGLFMVTAKTTDGAEAHAFVIVEDSNDGSD